MTDFTVTKGDPNDVDVYVDSEKVDLANATYNSIKIESTGSEDGVNYEFSVSGELTKGEQAGSDDEVSGSTATGSVGGGWYDTYEFGGQVTDFTVTKGDPNDVDVFVDGSRII
jgi:hypothetical protein